MVFWCCTRRYKGGPSYFIVLFVCVEVQHRGRSDTEVFARMSDMGGMTTLWIGSSDSSWSWRRSCGERSRSKAEGQFSAVQTGRALAFVCLLRHLACHGGKGELAWRRPGGGQLLGPLLQLHRSTRAGVGDSCRASMLLLRAHVNIGAAVYPAHRCTCLLSPRPPELHVQDTFFSVQATRPHSCRCIDAGESGNAEEDMQRRQGLQKVLRPIRRQSADASHPASAQSFTRSTLHHNHLSLARPSFA